ncbi:hypothetical protein CPB85DRAFT_1291839 [Mucidula mucida]|nr:hypothetical protein CPB85DRAFT_1291839 [Mucidula mucida]
MSNLEKTLFQLKFTAKSLNRQAKKAQKDENSEKSRLKKALQQGNTDGARIYASNAIRKKSEALNLLRLSSRIDAVASRVETAVTMRQGMDNAMQTMNLERLMRQTAEEANIELQHDLSSKDLDSVPDLAPREKVREEDDKLAERLRALRPAT